MVDAGCCGDKRCVALSATCIRLPVNARRSCPEAPPAPSAEGAAVEVDIRAERDHAEPAREHRSGDLDGTDQDARPRCPPSRRRPARGLPPGHAAHRRTRRGSPCAIDRSNCPTQSTSTPGVAAISSTCWRPASVSICRITSVRVLGGAHRLADARPRAGRVEQPEPASVGSEARGLHDALGLDRVVDHRHHDATRTDVERRRDQVTRRPLHAHEQLDVRARPLRRAADGSLRSPQPVCSRSMQHEVGAGVSDDPRDAERIELEHHRAERRATPARRERSVWSVIAFQPRLSTTVFSSVRRSMENRPPTRPTPLCEPARPPNGRCDSQ